MLNTGFVKSMVQSYVNNCKELSEEEFCDLFGGLEESELDEVLELLDTMGVSVVGEKKENADQAMALGYLNSGMDAARLSALTNEQLCVLYQRGKRAAMEALARKNSRLVYKIAAKVYKEYRPESLEVEDLYIEGSIGLLKAAERFDVQKGFQFSTYACWWIRQAITRETMNNGYTLRLPVHIFEQVVAVKQCRSRRKPRTVFELQSFLAEEGRVYTVEKLDNLLIFGDKYMNTVSLNEIVGHGDSGDAERGEFIPAAVNVEADVMDRMMSEDISRALEMLKDRERAVIAKRFGLGDVVPMTLEQVGREFKVTRERIRQIESKALHKLAGSREVDSMREYLCA